MTVWVTSDSRHFIKRTVKIGLQQDGWTRSWRAFSLRKSSSRMARFF